MRSSTEMFGTLYVRVIEATSVVFPLSGGPIRMMRGCEGLGCAVCAHRTLPRSSGKMIRMRFSMRYSGKSGVPARLVCHAWQSTWEERLNQLSGIGPRVPRSSSAWAGMFYATEYQTLWWNQLAVDRPRNEGWNFPDG